MTDNVNCATNPRNRPHKAVNGSKGAPKPPPQREPPPDVPKRYTEGPEPPAEPSPELTRQQHADALELARYVLRCAEDRLSEAVNSVTSFYGPAVERARDGVRSACATAGHHWLEHWQSDGLGWMFDTCRECGAPRWRKPDGSAELNAG